MKASVLEIHKDHCIVITEDGRFIRRDMPAGVYEIGDEIVIEASDLLTAVEKPLKNPFGMFAKLAAGFAAIVILGGGAYLGIKYAGPGFAFNPVKIASQSAQAKTAASTGQEGADVGAVTLEQGEQNLAAAAPDSGSVAADTQPSESSADASNSGQSSSTSNQDSGQSDKTQPAQDSGSATSGTNGEKDFAPAPGGVLFEGTFKLEKNNIDILIDYPDLNISYAAKNSYGQDSGAGEVGIFTLKIKNMQKSTFTGNIVIIFIDKNSRTLQTSALEIGNMGFYDDYTEQIQIADNADSFIMTLYGSFNEPEISVP
jgi:hypothetical protein